MNDLALPREALGKAVVPVTGRERTWRARLELGCELRAGKTVLSHRRHEGPLRVQKPLYPDGPERAELVLIHPPAGIAGGDDLAIETSLGAGSALLVTTPGAAKWYRSGGDLARQKTSLRVAAGATLEWLPQENIVFNGAEARLATELELAHASRCIGWEIVVLGRHAANESFCTGSLGQRMSIFVDHRLLWRERAWLAGGDALLNSPAAWAGAHVGAVMWVYGQGQDDALIERCRVLTEAGVRLGVTRIDERLTLIRALASSPEALRRVLALVWGAARQAIGAPGASTPRIWAT